MVLRLTPIHSIECLVEEQSNRPACIYPWRTVLVKSWIIPKHSNEIDYDEAKAGKGDL
jgi:hypothetical protein